MTGTFPIWCTTPGIKVLKHDLRNLNISLKFKPTLTEIICILFNIMTLIVLHVCLVHGEWSVWAHWTTCSRTCGQGITRRLRSCTNPQPSLLSNYSLLGNYCFGDSTEYGVCLIKQCPGKHLFSETLYLMRSENIALLIIPIDILVKFCKTKDCITPNQDMSCTVLWTIYSFSN